MPALLPDWLPWWLQLLLWMAGTVIALGWIAMPFIVIGLRGRLTYVSEQLDEVHAELRMVAQRLPEPISAARYEALRARMTPEVTRGAADDGAYRMPPQRPAYPPPPRSPEMRSPEPRADHGYDPYDDDYAPRDEGAPPRREQAPPNPNPNPGFRPVLPSRPPLNRPDAYGTDDDFGENYDRRLSPPFRSTPPRGEPPSRGEPPRHEPRLRWPPRED